MHGLADTPVYACAQTHAPTHPIYKIKTQNASSLIVVSWSSPNGYYVTKSEQSGDSEHIISLSSFQTVFAIPNDIPNGTQLKQFIPCQYHR